MLENLITQRSNPTSELKFGPTRGNSVPLSTGSCVLSAA